MNRHTIRKHIFSMLFRVEFHKTKEMQEQDEFYLAGLEKVTDKEWAYMENRVNQVIAKIPEIDVLLENASEGWKISRMGKVELTILRLAVYEMKFDEDIPTNVAVNEAVELAKTFGGEESPAFVNGVLAKLI